MKFIVVCLAVVALVAVKLSGEKKERKIVKAEGGIVTYDNGDVEEV